MSVRASLCASGAALAIGLWFAPAAVATTFCVPGFHPACSDEEGAVASTLEHALTTDRGDGVADRIVIDAGTVQRSDGMNYSLGFGGDSLEIAGAGTGLTTLTNNVAGNAFAFNFNSVSKPALTIRDLTLEVPDTLTDGLGAGAQLSPGATLQRVDVISHNDDLSRALTFVESGSFRDGEISSAPGKLLDRGIRASDGAAPGIVSVEDAAITANTPIETLQGSSIGLALDRVRFSGIDGVVSVRGDSPVTISNSVLELEARPPMTGISAAIGVRSSPGGAGPTAVSADHVTLVGPGGPVPAGNTYRGLRAEVASGVFQDATVELRNSIVHGFSSDFARLAPIDPTAGDANIEVTHSVADLASVVENGDGAIIDDGGNITADPMFAGVGDFHLAAGSPAIDAGDPVFGAGADLEGAPRVQDGEGDGFAVRDMGAYEVADTQAPGTKITKRPKNRVRTRHARASVRFRFEATQAAPAPRFQCRLAGGTKSQGKWRTCDSPMRFKVKAKRGKGKRYMFRVRARDLGENLDPSPANDRFRVKRR